MFLEPTDRDMAGLIEEAQGLAGDDARLQDNYLFASLFGHEAGFYSQRRAPANIWFREKDGSLGRFKTRMRAREWIERHFTIKPKGKPARLIVANAPQRGLEALILRMERAKLPVRIRILKPRQTGISTWVQARMFERVLRGQNQRGLIIADKDERAELLLEIANTARKKMPRSAEENWDFKMRSKATYSHIWDMPIDGSINITSAQVSYAGHGGTKEFLHTTETSRWKDAETTAIGVLESLPDMPDTYWFDESTANGDTGWFAAEFKKSWGERDKPLFGRRHPVIAYFFGWQQHDEYRWTRTVGEGRELPQEMIDEIRTSLDAEEEWLLTQRVFVRKVGWKTVDYDQLAWRRMKIDSYSELGGVRYFNEQHPSRPDVAFLATGSRVFDPEVLAEYRRNAKKPVWRGTLEDPSVVVSGAKFGDEAFEQLAP